VQKIRRQFGLGKVGHAGTLDPNATGVLVLCLGDATRFIRFLPTDPKEYHGEIVFGIRTDTLDMTGHVLVEERSDVTLEQVQEVSHQFLGTINQIPPMVSAVKSNGKPLYLLARKGITVERKSRPVRIFNLVIKELTNNDHQKAVFEVTCSKGTYVRTLCQDMGAKLGCGACMGNLKRVRSGAFGIEKAQNLDELLRAGSENLEKGLISLNDALGQYRVIRVNADSGSRFVRGGSLVFEMTELQGRQVGDGERIRIVDENGRFLGMAEAVGNNHVSNSEQTGGPLLKPICVIPVKQV
jgi:tRNA pseudouridine55 synthase